MDVMWQINLADVVFLITALFVFLKILGLTLFEAGLVQAKNVNDIIAKNLTVLALGILLFCLVSHQIIVSSSHFYHYLPFFKIAFIQDLFMQPRLSYLFLQMLFAIIPVSIVIGITAERLLFWSLFFFALFMFVIIYPMVTFWVWGNGFLNQAGFIDIGGAAVMHLTGAICGFTALIFLGYRNNRFNKKEILAGSNMPISAIGFIFIWLGFFGINIATSLLNYPGGSLNQIPAILFNTCAAGAGGLLVSLLICRIIYGIVDISLLANGAVAGLVAICAAPLSPHLATSIFIGAVAGLLCLLTTMLLNKLHFDDPIGAISAHGVGAIWGILAVVFSHNYLYLAKGASNDFMHVLLIQCLGIIVITVWVFIVSLIFWSIIRFTLGLRISPQDEYKGLDILQCGLGAYPEFISSAVEK